MSDEFVVT